MDKVRINMSEIKLDDMTVTFQSRYPSSPIMNNTAYMQLTIGAATQMNFLKIMTKVMRMNSRTPNPKLMRSFFMKVIISSVIIGIPPNLISYLSFE